MKRIKKSTDQKTFHYLKSCEVCYNVNNILVEVLKKAHTVLLLLVFVMVQPVSAQEEPVDRYVGSNGLEVLSYTENWQGDQLIQIYDELMANTHGEEMSYLESVSLFGEESPDGQEEGLYSYSLKKWDFLTGSSVRLQKGSTISLYHMDDKDTIQEVARVLSHEYGHHFTIYYLAKNDPDFFGSWENSEFYRARQGDRYPSMSEEIGTEHQWLIAEICAEDYVQLYGSPLAKTWVKVYDIEERAKNDLLDEEIRYSSQIYNIVPQENMSIPLALEVEKVTGYWETISGFKPILTNYSAPEVILGERRILDKDYIAQVIEWSASFNESGQEATVYTLVAINRKTNQFLPIKSTSSSEPKRAVVGSIAEQIGYNKRIYSDSFVMDLGLDGYDDLRVIALGQNGEAISSPSYIMDFSQGTLVRSSDSLLVSSADISKVENNRRNTPIDVLDRLFDLLFTVFEKISESIPQ